MSAVAEILAALNLDDLRAGRHIVRDSRRWKTGELCVDGVWVAKVEPSFHPHCALGVSREKERVRAAFSCGPASEGSNQGIFTTMVERSIEWDDPVATILRKADLFELSGGISLDGIGYEIQVRTLASETTISFFNPTTNLLVSLGRALIELATEISRSHENENQQEYVENVWMGYSSGRTPNE